MAFTIRRSLLLCALLILLIKITALFAEFDFGGQVIEDENFNADTLTSVILPDTSLTCMIIKAVEYDEWQAIADSVASFAVSDRLFLLPDSLNAYYAAICGPRLLEKVTADFCNGLALVLAQNELPEPSLYFFAKACSICYKYDYPEGIIANLLSQATVMNALGRKQPAADRTVEALARAVEMESLITPQAENMIPLLSATGNLPVISARIDAAYPLDAPAVPQRDRNLGRAHLLIGFAYAGQESLDQARAEAERSVALFSGIDLPYEEIMARFTLASIRARKDPADTGLSEIYYRIIALQVKQGPFDYSRGVLKAWIEHLKSYGATQKLKDIGIARAMIGIADSIAAAVHPDDHGTAIAGLSYLLATTDLLKLSGQQRMELLKSSLDGMNAQRTVFRLRILLKIAQSYADQKKSRLAAQYIAQGLSQALASRDWDHIETFYEMIKDNGPVRIDADSIAAGIDDWAKAALKTISRQDLEGALSEFSALGDTSAQARVELALGYGDEAADYPNARTAESHFWNAYFLALAHGDTSLALAALSAALDDPYDPVMYLRKARSIADIARAPEAFKINNAVYIARRLADDAENFYEEASSIFEGCGWTAAALADPRGDDLAAIRIELDTGLGRTGIRIDERAETLVTRPRFETLLSYFDAAYRTAEQIDADEWSLNFYSEMKGHVNLGWADRERSLANRQYGSAVSRARQALGPFLPRIRLSDYYGIFSPMTKACRELLWNDTLIASYEEFQDRFKGRTYRGLTAEQREKLHETIMPAFEQKSAALIKYDCVGFGDRAFSAASSGKLGDIVYYDIIGKPGAKFLITGNLLMPRIAARTRFNYLEVVPAGWSMSEIARITGSSALWRAWLSRDRETARRWSILEGALRIELGQFPAAESLLASPVFRPDPEPILPWTAAVATLLRAQAQESCGDMAGALENLDRADEAAADFEKNGYFRACVNGTAGNILYVLGDTCGARLRYIRITEAGGNDTLPPSLTRRLMISLGNLALLQAVPTQGAGRDIDTDQVLLACRNYDAALQNRTGRIDPVTGATARINRAITRHLLGRNGEAFADLRDASDSARAYDRTMLLASAQLVGGYIHARTGGLDAARQSCDSAVAAFRSAGDRYALSNALCLRSIALEGLARKDEALADLRESVGIFESLRTGLKSDDLAASFTGANIDRYAAIISLLMESNRGDEALAYVERSKSRELRDAFNIDRLSPRDTSVTAALRQASGLGRSLSSQEGQLARELGQEPDRRDSARIASLSSLIAGTKAEFLSLESRIRKLNPDYESLIKITPGQLAKVQKLLPEGSILVEYYPAIDNLYIFLITKDIFRTRSVAAARDSVYTLVRKFRAIIEEASNMAAQGIAIEPITTWQDDESDRYRETILPLKNTCAALYALLIEPLENDLPGINDIIVVPTGLLAYLPFHALGHDGPGGFEFFIEEKNVSYVSSAELIDIAAEKTRTVKPATLLGFADPDGTLPSAGTEVEAIKKIFPGSAVFTGSRATEERAAGLSNRYNILHCATHARLNYQNPDESYIQLAQSGNADGRWSMYEIFGMAWDNMDLVVLSACETALGEKDPGREVAALSYAFSVAGSPSIIASLWPVFDPSTESFMRSYYQMLKKESKTAALRQAQISLLYDPRYAHPFFWAPFVLIGDWR